MRAGGFRVSGARAMLRGWMAGLAAACAAVASGAGCGPGADARRVPERVLLVTLDTTRADRLGCYGGTAATPSLDRLAREGVRFARAVAPAPLTLPTHATLLTGTYPVRHGVRNNGTYRLGPELVTLAERFREAGYRTGAIVGSVMLDSRFGLDRGFDHYDDDIPSSRDEAVLAAERPAGEVTHRALAWARDQEPGRWFLWVHYFDPHFPYSPPEPFATRFRDRPYDGEVAYTDAALGDLLEGLAARGLLEGTLVAVTADHGESLGEHAERSHGLFIYEATLAVPLIVRWSAGLPRGRVVRDLVRSIDVAPTLLDLCHLRPLPAAQGESLAAAARGAAFEGRAALMESWLPRLNYGWSELVGIQDVRWKFIRAPLSELYDLGSDPGERDNRLARDPAVAEEYAGRLQRLLLEASAGAAFEPPPAPAPDAETERLLRGLGYLGASGPEPGARLDPAAAGPGADRLADPKEKVAEFADLSEALPLLAGGRVAEAVERLERARAANPDSILIQRQLGNAYRRQGRLREAEESLRAALRWSPSSTGARVDLAAVLTDRDPVGAAGREAEAILRSAQQEDPQLASARYQLGVLLHRRGRRQAAIAQYREALALDPRMLPGLVNLALLLEERGDLQEAEALYRRAIELDPANPRLHTSAAWLLFRRGNFTEAAALLRRAADLEPDSSRPLVALSQVLEKVGDRAGALAALRLGVEREGPAGEAALELARGLLRQGDACAAMRALEEVARGGSPPVRARAAAELNRARSRCAAAAGPSRPAGN